jgi:hypothetical protein
MVEDFDCSEMIFVIDACFSGGFVEELESNHRTIQTCTNGEMVMIINKELGYNYLTYAYATALKGYHPNIGEPWSLNLDAPIGSQDLSELCDGCWPETEDVDPDSEIGGNSDGYYQTGEAFAYAAYLNGQIENEGQNYQNHGFIGDLLTLNGIEGRVDTSQSISGNYLIGRKLTLVTGVVLSDYSTYQNHCNLFLNDSTEILVDDSATLNINGYYTKFHGCSEQSFVNIQGDVSEDHMYFQANPGATININFNNSSNKYALDYFSFQNASIHAACDSLSFSFTGFEDSPLEFNGNYLTINNVNVFDNSDLVLKNGSVTITEANDFNDSDIEFSGEEIYINGLNDFINSDLDLSYGNIIIEEGNDFINSTISVSHPVDEDAFIEIYGNQFDNDTTIEAYATLTIQDYSNFLVDSNQFDYEAGRGIELFYAGWDSRTSHQVQGNTITFEGPWQPNVAELGIHAYFSNVGIQNNRIFNNDFGITGFHQSELAIRGDSTAEDYMHTQLIADNKTNQCVFNQGCFPYEFRWNVIRDTSYTTKPYIRAVEEDEMLFDTTQMREWEGDPIFDVRYNCWVNDTNPSARLVPLGAYDWRPVWCPGEGRNLLENEPELMFYQAVTEIGEENYTEAESDFKQIISLYPEDKFARASLKELLALNPALYDSAYSTLKSYCDSLAQNPGDSLLGKSAKWLSIRCDTKNKQYQLAINSLDSIIENPGTYADSIFAMIDLSDIYDQMSDTTGFKITLATRHPDVIPVSRMRYLNQRKNWIEQLLRSCDEQRPENLKPIKDPEIQSPGKIISIYPNPMKGNITIDFIVEQKGNVNLSIVTISGQILSVLFKNTIEPGSYHKTINNINLPAGMYNLILSLDNVVADAGKLLIVK